MVEQKAYHHGNLRQSLIDQSLKTLEEVGLEDLSLRALAESLGVSKTAPYRHFPTKRDLLSALAAEGYQIFADMLEKEEPKLTKLNKNQCLKRMYKIYGDFALKQPELYRLMFSKLGNSLHSERCKINAQRGFGVLTRLSRKLMEGPGDARSMVLSLYASLHGWVMILLDDLIPPEVGVSWTNWEEFALRHQET